MTTRRTRTTRTTRSRSRWSAAVAFVTWSSAVLTLALTNGCITSVDSASISKLSLPDKTQYINGGVSLFMEQRCGALDCHGQTGRPLRIYSVNGLRLQDGANGARDTSDTNAEERKANYFSTVGLEPEAISSSLQTKGEYTDFLLLKKPLGIEGNGVRHKGGPVLRSTDPGFECLITWISGAVDKDKCKLGLIQ